MVYHRGDVHRPDVHTEIYSRIQEASNKEVRRGPCSLEFIPDNLMTQEMRNEVVEADSYTLNFLPVDFWSYEIFYRAFDKYLHPMRYVPDHLKT